MIRNLSRNAVDAGASASSKRPGTTLCEPVGLYSEAPAFATRVYVGEISAVQGDNGLMLKVVAKHPASWGRRFDAANVVCIRT
ncbi:MAG TPA: hypothetical protein VGE01_10270 [Fimbriimonas sp.]